MHISTAAVMLKSAGCFLSRAAAAAPKFRLKKVRIATALIAQRPVLCGLSYFLQIRPYLFSGQDRMVQSELFGKRGTLASRVWDDERGIFSLFG